MFVSNGQSIFWFGVFHVERAEGREARVSGNDIVYTRHGGPRMVLRYFGENQKKTDAGRSGNDRETRLTCRTDDGRNRRRLGERLFSRKRVVADFHGRRPRSESITKGNHDASARSLDLTSSLFVLVITSCYGREKFVFIIFVQWRIQLQTIVISRWLFLFFVVFYFPF